MEHDSKIASPVYCSWTTFQNALDQLAKATPSHLDRSAFTGIAWSVQSQLLTGLRFLGLIDDTGKSSDDLVTLAEDVDNRKKNWEKLLRRRYGFVFDAIDLSTATPKQLEDVMAANGAGSRDTQDKAVRFFLSAADFVGIKLSPFLNKARKATPTRKRRTNGRKPGSDTHGPQNPSERAPVTQPTGLTVNLQSGGTLSVSATVDLFSVSTEDRKFVFKLIDDLRNYEAKTKKEEA